MINFDNDMESSNILRPISTVFTRYNVMCNVLFLEGLRNNSVSQIKSQYTLLHPGLNDQIQNTEVPHVTQALLGGIEWQPGSGSADFNYSANHIGIQLLSTTQPTLIGHTQYIKPCPSQFSVPHVCMEMAKFLCAIFC